MTRDLAVLRTSVQKADMVRTPTKWVAGSAFLAVALVSGASWAQPQPQQQPQGQWGAQVGTNGSSWNAQGNGFQAPKKLTGFGVFNDFALTGSLGNVVSYTSRSQGDKSAFEVGVGTAIGGLGLDYFVVDGLSIGGDIRYRNDRDLKTIGLAPRIGYNIDLNDTFSIWPGLGIEYKLGTTSSTTNVPATGASPATTYDNKVEVSTFALNVRLPFLYHVAKNFFLGAGPTFSVDLVSKVKTSSNDPSVKGETTDGIKETTIGLAALVGGHF
jgi:opacity protein-like surface antigen